MTKDKYNKKGNPIGRPLTQKEKIARIRTSEILAAIKGLSTQSPRSVG